MHALICGSLAFDTIMVFRDQFKNHILPEQVHILSVSFLVPDLRKEYGGCAGNIAYNLKLLGGKPQIMATVGDDFGFYADRLDEIGISRANIRIVPGMYTAQCFITTDIDDNQISAFHPGAMSASCRNHVADAKDVSIGIISPDDGAGMLQHAEEFKAAGIPFIFDPGQALAMFGGPELSHFIELADYVTVNDYEAKLLEERTGRTVDDHAKHCKALIVTRGALGSTIFTEGKRIEIPSVPPSAVVDPTGCGDAYRAGILYGIQAGWDWQRTGQLASLLGSLKIPHRGAQNHKFTRSELADRYRVAFGGELWQGEAA
jgi:adenosine kinase